MTGKTIHRTIEGFVKNFDYADLFHSNAKFVGYNKKSLAEMLFKNMDKDENNFPRVNAKGKITSFLSLDNKEGNEACYIEFEWNKESEEWRKDFKNICEAGLIFKCDICESLIFADDYDDNKKICNDCKEMRDEMFKLNYLCDENGKRLNEK